MRLVQLGLPLRRLLDLALQRLRGLRRSQMRICVDELLLLKLPLLLLLLLQLLELPLLLLLLRDRDVRHVSAGDKRWRNNWPSRRAV